MATFTFWHPKSPGYTFKFNPYHDTKGRFASGPGGAMAPGEGSEADREKVLQSLEQSKADRMRPGEPPFLVKAIKIQAANGKWVHADKGVPVAAVREAQQALETLPRRSGIRRIDLRAELGPEVEIEGVMLNTRAEHNSRTGVMTFYGQGGERLRSPVIEALVHESGHGLYQQTQPAYWRAWTANREGIPLRPRDAAINAARERFDSAFNEKTAPTLYARASLKQSRGLGVEEAFCEVRRLRAMGEGSTVPRELSRAFDDLEAVLIGAAK